MGICRIGKKLTHLETPVRHLLFIIFFVYACKQQAPTPLLDSGRTTYYTIQNDKNGVPIAVAEKKDELKFGNESTPSSSEAEAQQNAEDKPASAPSGLPSVNLETPETHSEPAIDIGQGDISQGDISQGNQQHPEPTSTDVVGTIQHGITRCLINATGRLYGAVPEITVTAANASSLEIYDDGVLLEKKQIELSPQFKSYSVRSTNPLSAGRKITAILDGPNGPKECNKNLIVILPRCTLRNVSFDNIETLNARSSVTLEASFTSIEELSNPPNIDVYQTVTSTTHVGSFPIVNSKSTFKVNPTGTALNQRTNTYEVVAKFGDDDRTVRCSTQFQWGPNYSPLVFSLSNQKITLTSQEDGILFDLDGSGQKRQISWISDQDQGFLAYDRDGNGVIDNGTELFGNHTILEKYNLKAQNGFHALRQYDKNNDKKITAADDMYDQLVVWFDRNFDGVSQKSELVSLRQLDIQTIDLDYRDIIEIDDYGNSFLQKSYLTTGEKTISLYDLWFEPLAR